MKSYGVKALDKNDALTYEYLNYAKDNGYAIEVGLYKGSEKFREYLLDIKDSIDLNFHFDHTKYSIFELSYKNNLEKLEKDIRLAKKFNVKYAIMHTAKTPMSRRKEYQRKVFEHLFDQFIAANELCRRYDFEIYLENTYQSIPFYEKLFREFRKKDIDRVNFCFDLGHAKVWSENRYAEWMTFLEELRDDGFKLHFHLHANRGTYDEHLSFVEADELGILEPDEIFSCRSYPRIIKELFEVFPEETKIFEVKPEFVIENLQYVEKNILII
jgi:sugar phosphate isomerase/epimerase